MYVNGTVYAAGNLYLNSGQLNALQQDVSYSEVLSESLAPGDTHGMTAGTPTFPPLIPPHLGPCAKPGRCDHSQLDANFVGAGVITIPAILWRHQLDHANQNDKGYHESIDASAIRLRQSVPTHCRSTQTATMNAWPTTPITSSQWMAATTCDLYRQ